MPSPNTSQMVYEETDAGAETECVFQIDQLPTVKWGPALIRDELGEDARRLVYPSSAGTSGRVALFTDKAVVNLEIFEDARRSLEAAGVEYVVYDEVTVEPTDASFKHAAAFASEGGFSAFVSVGGGSVIDTCKVANLLSRHPADLMDYVNAPLGKAVPPPGPLHPHIACPTTTGTGTECTGYAICDISELGVKSAIAHKYLRPTMALVDPHAVKSLPRSVLAASGFDVLSHAAESFTARPYTSRARTIPGTDRPLAQGANPWSDIGCREALRLAGLYFERALQDPDDTEARAQLSWAATLAGVGMGNAGTALPHGMSYPVSHGVHQRNAWKPPDGYGNVQGAILPHGFAVILGAPAAMRYTASASPERHLEAAFLLGADVQGAQPEDAGEVLAGRVVELMKVAGTPSGLAELGFGMEDLETLVQGTICQKRVVNITPRDVTEEVLRGVFTEAIEGYW